ncbi:hypothetical protein SmJEL517_g04393 [Synchytrium microbalum]|uniref:Exonuclease V n=1 Tax=Synchytrium microbalum TaxID=1806994 RepID=A0A507C0G2_9FUNG|nr:uncharacterized protein SmJEL517_g04393 [Synchytrium microbalum]TPX32539.1 hypothetical protein SmJEL517_g04393 [Synchytrium microbalum]
MDAYTEGLMSSDDDDIFNSVYEEAISKLLIADQEQSIAAVKLLKENSTIEDVLLQQAGPAPSSQGSCSDAPIDIEDLPIAKFKTPWPSRISVTDIAYLTWCESQTILEKVTRKPRRQTKAMSIGQEIHKTLELELGPPIEVAVTTKEDVWGLRFLNAVFSIDSLVNGGGLAREIPVLGRVGDFLVFGIIDEVIKRESEDGSCTWHLRDTKTRMRRSLPGEVSSRMGKLQVATYRKMFLEMPSLDQSFVFTKLGLDQTKPLSQPLVDQFKLLGLDTSSNATSSSSGSNGSNCSSSPVRATSSFKTARTIHNQVTLNKLFPIVQSYFELIPTISETLELSYVHQKSKEVIDVVRFVYDGGVLDGVLEQARSLFNGERVADGVSVEEAYKCQSCDYVSYVGVMLILGHWVTVFLALD